MAKQISKTVVKKDNKKAKGLPLVDMTIAELNDKIRETVKMINKSKLEKTVGRLKNIKDIWKLRKELAQTKTVANFKLRLNSVKSEDK